MVNALRIVFGIGIGVVLYVLLLLGIQAFYPEVRYEHFCDDSEMYPDPYMDFAKCPDNMTVGECRANVDMDSKEREQCSKDFEAAMKVYNQNFFIIASILGMLTIIAAYLLFNFTSSSTINISSGSACSGIVMVLWAFIRGWESTNDMIKFGVAIVVAVVVIILTTLINRKLAGQKKKK